VLLPLEDEREGEEEGEEEEEDDPFFRDITLAMGEESSREWIEFCLFFEVFRMADEGEEGEEETVRLFFLFPFVGEHGVFLLPTFFFERRSILWMIQKIKKKKKKKEEVS